jgi:glycosyltransferase involved in cell wall biosynthesis
MKILHIIPSYYPAIKFGGPIQSVHLLNKALVKKGVKVDVLTTNAGLSRAQSAERKAEWCDVDGVRVKYLSFIGYEHYNFSLQVVKEIWRNINNYDLVHITAIWNFPVLVGSIISLIKKKPYLISPRGSIYRETIEIKSSIFKKMYFWLFAKHYLNKSNAIHFTTEDEEEKVTAYLKLKARQFVIPNGIDLEEIKSMEQSAESNAYENYILILGRIDRKKGFDILIPSFAKICQDNNDIKLVIAGDDTTTYAQGVRKMIDDWKIGERIIFTGQVAGGYKWNLYKNALMFVLPSYSENFGNVIIEAMACGCPVVISNKVGVYNEVAENNAGIIVETNSNSVVEGMNKLLNEINLRNQIAINGKSMVKQYYDINKVADQMIDQYRKILGDNLDTSKI